MSITDWQQKWWIAAERNDRETRVCVYTVPDLERIHVLPGLDVEELAVLGRAGILVVIPRLAQKTLVLHDLKTSREITRLQLPPHDYAGSWHFVADPSERYIGVRGCQWVHLFAVRSEPQG